MTQIRIENLGFSYGEPLFSGITLTIAEEHRVGVVGNNGAGKSTLLRCITGELEPTTGLVTKPKSARFGVIEQEVPSALRDKTLYDVIASAIPEEERDFNTWKVDIALDSFKAPIDIREKPIRHLSGGWQRLALIARTWVAEPDILLLDEPTNHLDLEKILLLEQWLNEQVQGVPLLCISHDRRFLDNCTNTTLFVRPGKSQAYPHPFSRARELLADDDRAATAQRDKEVKEIRRLETSAHTLRQIGKNDHSDEAALKARRMADRAKELKASMTEVPTEIRRDVKLATSDVAAKWLVRIQNLVVSAPDGRPLFTVDKMDLAQGDRVVILGMNGAGKSCFVDTIHQAFKDLGAAKEKGIQITPLANLGYVDQHLSGLPLDFTMRDYIADRFRLPPQGITSKLVETGFPYNVQEKKISQLSYGERSRLYLLGLRLAQPNFYIMDEPTNHLDIAGQEQLEAEILDHQASAILVSHDRSFVSALGTKFLVIHRGRLMPIEDPNDFYRHVADGTPLFTEDAKKKPRDKKPVPK
jgi:ATPase subunit of ABC transporter with duplicated ATPase domains